MTNPALLVGGAFSAPSTALELLQMLREVLVVQVSVLANTETDPHEVAAELASWVYEIELALKGAGQTAKQLRPIHSPVPTNLTAALRQSRANLRETLHLTGQLLEAIDRADLAEATPDLKDACKFARAEHTRLLEEVRRG